MACTVASSRRPFRGHSPSARLFLVAPFACLLVVGASSRLCAQAVPQAEQPTAVRGNALMLELHATQAERAAETHLWPALLLGVGAGSVAAGTVVAVSGVLACRGSCLSAGWVSLAIVAGVALTTAGAIWWIRVDHDIAQLDAKKSMLRSEAELSSLRSSMQRRELALGAGAPLVTLRFAL